MNKYKIILLVLVAVLAQFAVIETAMAADCNTNGCWINGSILRSDSNGALTGAIVFNTTNTSQTDTTGADGYFNISGFKNQTNHNLTVTAPSGFTSSTILSINVSGADNTTSSKTLTIKTPVNSAITESGITTTSATIAWTVSDSYVGNRLVYSTDSALGTNTFTTAWSNSTASPSFLLTNLKAHETVYYRVEAYNIANSSYSDTDTGDFDTLVVKATSKKTPVPTPVQTVVIKKKSPFASLVGSDSSTGSDISSFGKVLAVIILIGLVWIGLSSRGKSSKPKSKKKR